MKRPLKRRDFLNLAVNASLIPLSIKLMGCGPAEINSSKVANDESAKYTTVKDIRLQLGIRNGVLKASDIAAGNDVTLYYDEGGHRHGFTVTKAEYAKIITGEVVTVTTEKAQGHDHKIRIDPANNPPGADSVDISTAELPKVYAALSNDETPDLFLAADQDLTENSAMYCTQQAAVCDSNEGIWQALSPTTEVAGVKAYKSAPLTLTNNSTVSLRAKYGDEKTIKQVLKFLAK